MGSPDSAKAIGGFNLTAQPIGFLQPLFAGGYGDNQTYIQRLDGLTKIAGFKSVAWPERDTVLFGSPLSATVNEESLWSFAFPNERPLVLPWTKFREFPRERIDTSVFSDHPLLQFDVAQTLDLDENKPSIFSRAFQTYARAGSDVAERWRDRAIVEPALVDALHTAGIFAKDSQHSVRTRLVDGVARIELAAFDPLAVDLLDKVYRDIAARYDSIFPRIQRVEVLPKSLRQGFPDRESKPVTIILVGKLRNGEPEASLDYGREIDVIDADHLLNHLRRKRPSQLFLMLARQSDWEQLVDTGNNIKNFRSLAIIFSAATEPLLSDLDIQRELPIPSVLMFALAREFTHRGNSLRSIRPLIDILSLTSRRSHESFDVGRMPAKHCLMLREEIRPDYEVSEVGCRIGARAIRAGVRAGARVDLFVDGSSAGAEGNEWGQMFEPLFAIPYPSETTLPKHGLVSYLTLLADRSEPISQFTSVQEGAVRLLMMRGWRVERTEQRLMISDDNRQFPAVFVERKDDMPAEDRTFRRPSFGRSHLLIIHANPSRETLLIGNRGQYCHITLEDISLMRPDSQWIWAVLRRQLDRTSFFRIDKAMSSLLFVASAGRFTGYDPG
jgi:hypothetical protein